MCVNGLLLNGIQLFQMAKTAGKHKNIHIKILLKFYIVHMVIKLFNWLCNKMCSFVVLSLTEVSGSTPSTAISSTRPRHTKSMSASGHPSKSTLPPIDDNTELKARFETRSKSSSLPIAETKANIFSFAVPPLAALPTLHLHTVLAPRRRTVSPVEPPVAAHSTGPSLETDAAPPTMAPQLHPHCLMTQGLLLSNAGAHLQGSSARSPQSLSAGQ